MIIGPMIEFAQSFYLSFYHWVNYGIISLTWVMITIWRED